MALRLTFEHVPALNSPDDSARDRTSSPASGGGWAEPERRAGAAVATRR
jgi:hypothetical protein